MISLKSRKLSIFGVIGLLFAVSLFQAIFSNIGLDEAYYWNFGQHLAWGYFDHPPMVALMIAIGSSVLPDVIGVRIVTVIMMTAMYWMIWNMIPSNVRDQKQAPWVFLLVIFINPIFSIYGFFTTPDVPLLFFTTAYLFAFKRFLSRSTIGNALLLGFLMSCLIYSKYHGILVILFSLFSRIKLLVNPRFYLASIVGIVLYLPHIYWEYQHDFVSFEYHLFYRSSSFNVKNIFEYILNSILILNPLIFPLFLVGFLKKRSVPLLSPVMNMMFWGFIAFFAITSVRGHVEPHWIAVATIPMTIALVQIVLQSNNLLQWFKVLGLISVLILVTLRILIILPLNIDTQFHAQGESFFKKIESIAGNNNVVFTNSYTASSKYSFYTGKPAFSYNFISYRKNQFDLWNVDEEYWMKPALFLTYWDAPNYNLIDQGKGNRIFYKQIEALPLVNQIKVKLENYPHLFQANQLIGVDLIIDNPYNHEIDFQDSNNQYLWQIDYYDLKKNRIKSVYMQVENLDKLQSNSSSRYHATFLSIKDTGSHTIGVALLPTIVFPVSVSKRTYPIKIE